MKINNGFIHPMFGRRELIVRAAGMFSLVGLGAAITKASAQTSSTLLLTPQEEEGPFFVDEKLNHSDIITDVSDNSITPGLPMTLSLTVSQYVNGVVTPLPNAYVDIWQANAAGLYSDEASEGTVGKKFLRGYQVTDANGAVRFLTIYPGWYSGRTAHIHARIRIYSGATVTYSFETMFFLDDTITNQVYQYAPYNSRANRDTYNATDRVYNYIDCTTGALSGKELLLTLAASSTQAIASYNLILDLSAAKPVCSGVSDGGVNTTAGTTGGGTTTTPGGGTRPGGGTGPGGSGPGGHR